MTNDHVWELIARKYSGEATSEELAALEVHLKNEPELSHQIELLEIYFLQPKSGGADSAEKKNAWKKIQSRLNQEFPEEYPVRPLSLEPAKPSVFNPARYRNRLAAAASIVLLIVSLSVYYSARQHSNSASPQVAESKEAVVELETGKGARLKKVLPDGTEVWLNGDSHLSYNRDFGKRKREITLVGEAFFDVAHNTRAPLTVHAKDVNILVTGTAFNVRSYPGDDEVETALIRGSVEVSSRNRPERVVRLKPNEKITIGPDDPVQSPSFKAPEADKKPEPAPIYQIEVLKESPLADMIPEVSWVENVLLFDNEPFGQVIDKMEKWYNVEIQIQNQQLKSRRFSGVFKDENVIQALEALQIIISFQFEQREKMIVIK